jgi:hypothetical protein
MGANGKQRVMNDFTFDAQMRQYMRLFAELGLDCGRGVRSDREEEVPVTCKFLTTD